MQREENYNEYLRLLQDDDYLDVTYDIESGGVSAVHRLHKFDKQLGLYGLRRGEYERISVNILREYGYRITLESEISKQKIRICDGYLDDVPMEIKAVEGDGIWTICTKLLQAEKQHAYSVVLFFPENELYSEERVIDGLGKYLANPDIKSERTIKQLLAVSRDGVLAVLDKKATPIEGWSIEEGFRGQNGANPFTIPPSDAKV